MPHELSFGGGDLLRRDSNGDHYLAPQWKQSAAGVGVAAHRYPYLYMVNKPITFSTIQFKKRPNSEDLTEPIAIKGVGSDGAWFGPGEMFVNDGLAYPAGPLEGTEGEFSETPKLFSATTKYDPEYSVNWMFSTDGKPFDDPEKEWESAGTTSHILYACLVDPESHDAPLYRTIVHLACGSGASSTPSEARESTWGQLTGCQFKGWSGTETSDAWQRSMFYYEPGTTASQNAPSFVGQSPLRKLLVDGRGQCLAWVELLIAACKTNGEVGTPKVLQVYDTRINPDTSQPFGIVQVIGIANWTIPQNGTNNNEYKDEYPYLIPYPSGSALNINTPYGDLTNIGGVSGQGALAPSSVPSIKMFDHHVIADFSGTLLDPSYGVQYASIADIPFVFAGYRTNPYPDIMVEKRVVEMIVV